MIKIKHNPTKKHAVGLNIREQIIHNAYYLPRRKTRSKLYRAYETYEGFGYGLADKAK